MYLQRVKKREKREKKKKMKDRPFRLDRFFSFLLSLLWSATLVTFFVGKIVFEGLESFVTHYTNWNWTISMTYFLSDLFSYIEDPKKPYYLFTLIASWYWTMFGSAWLVFWLVFVMFQQNPAALTDLSTEHGGKFSMGFLLNMNAVFHYLPAIVATIYTFLRRKEIRRNVVAFLVNTSTLTRVFYILPNMFGPLFYIGAYHILINIVAVYKITINPILLILIVILLDIFFVGITMMLFRYSAMRKKRIKE